jgi:hypothetical protein
MKLSHKTISLPSEGFFYDNELSCGKIQIYPFTAHEEDILSENSSNDYELIDQILKSMIVNDVNIDDLLAVDVDAILLAQRIISYGTSYDVKITCPHCSDENDYSLDLKKITSVDKIYNFSNIIQFENYSIEVVPETWEMRKKCKSKSDTLKNIIKSVTKHNSIDDFVDNRFLSRDAREFRKKYKSIMPELNFSLFTCSCKACDKPMPINLKINRSFFGLTPNYKITLHKEIFNLAYFSEGAFNQDIVYRLPVYLRRFYLNELRTTKEKEKEQSQEGFSPNEKSEGVPRGPFGKK